MILQTPSKVKLLSLLGTFYIIATTTYIFCVYRRLFSRYLTFLDFLKALYMYVQGVPKFANQNTTISFQQIK